MRLVKYSIAAIALSAILATAATFAPPEEYPRSGEHYTTLAPKASSHMDDPAWLFDLGWAYFEEGMNDDAMRYLDRALELRPKMAFLDAKIGDVFLSMGEEDSAASHYEAALNKHYEYIEVWEKLVEIRPAYYANLGLLYSEKATDSDDAALIAKAKDYLGRYVRQFPDGEFAAQCKAAISRLDLQERQNRSHESLESELRSAQAKEAKRKADQKAAVETFRSQKPFLVGIGFYSIGMDNDQDFLAKNPDEVIDDTLSLKTYATSLSEFGASFGYVMGPLFLRSSFQYGSNSSGKNYFLRDPVKYDIDSTQTPWDSTLSTKDDVRPKVSSVDTWRITASADYNLYYRDPVLLFAGVQAGIGGARLNDSPYDNFEGVTLAGAGLGGGIMFRFSDFLIEFAYRRNIVGSAAGGAITVAGSYKF